jgi:glyoxylase-like metal-dependent hydrolase (beta-lactamase superfamily II)
MKRYEPKGWLDAAKSRKDVAALNLPTAEPPQQTFKENRFVLEDASRRVEFHFFGWAHTRGDGFVYLPKERIVCTGDAAVNGPFNYLGHGNSVNWPNVLAQVQKLNAMAVLPGHGVPGGAELLSGQRQFLIELNRAVSDAVRGGKKLEDLVSRKSGSPATTSVRLSEAVKPWAGEWLPDQVEIVYKEITMKKPHGEIVGGK